MTTESLLHRNIRISGHVQGVGYRYSARSVALRLGIKGYIQNLPGGDVYLEAEGNQDQMAAFVNWCWQGPARARIDSVNINIDEVVGFQSFEIRP
jgi:acylphosphatase